MKFLAGCRLLNMQFLLCVLVFSFGSPLGSRIDLLPHQPPQLGAFSEGEEHSGYFANTLPHVNRTVSCDRLNDVIYRLFRAARPIFAPLFHFLTSRSLIWQGCRVLITLKPFSMSWFRTRSFLTISLWEVSPVDCRVVPSRDIEVPAVVELFSRKSAVDFQFKYRKDVFSEVVADVSSLGVFTQVRTAMAGHTPMPTVGSGPAVRRGPRRTDHVGHRRIP